MLKENSGKLKDYAFTDYLNRKRFESVREATRKTARLLKLDFELVRNSRATSPIFVYYEDYAGQEPVPLYCDEGKITGLEEISSTLRNMMFVLSFHPKHAALRQIRRELLRLS